MERLRRLVLGIIFISACAASVPLEAQMRADRPPTVDAIEVGGAAPPVITPSSFADFTRLFAQTPGPSPRHVGLRSLARDLVTDLTHLPSKENLLWAGLGGGLALAVHPLDDDVHRRITGNPTAKKVFKAGEIMGELGTLIGSASAVYVVGRLKDEPKVSHVGMDLIRSLAISEGLTQTLKYTTRRERPDHSSRNSFPSGHAADTFAFATALERHLGWRGAVPAYAFASYVAVSRMPANRHWLSDAVFGAVVGVIAGRTVTVHGRAYPVTVVSVPGGAAVVYTRRSDDKATPRFQ